MSAVRDAYLVGGVRTPVGRYGGALASVRPDDLAALVVGEVLRRAGVSGDEVDQVILGAANQAGEDNRNVARMAVLLAGLPPEVPAFTVNRLCASGLQAVASASAMVATGEADVIVAGGVESMTRAPWVMTKPRAAWAAPGEVADTALGWRLVNPLMRERDGGEATLTLGECTEKLARHDGITRGDSDEFALRSQTLATRAREDGRFDREMVAVPVAGGAPVTVDETIRPATNAAALAALRPSFGVDGIVTAGNASPLSDGASALLVVSEQAVARLGLTPRARVVAHASAGVAPSLFGLGPVPATEKLLARTGRGVADIDAWEINEAFAAQVLACERRLGLDRARINTRGGAIALGHPLGSSGARLLVTLLGRLADDDLSSGVATLCVGVGQGAAMLVERV
jgi:acetyl-CoA acetyltransferase family protein